MECDICGRDISPFCTTVTRYGTRKRICQGCMMTVIGSLTVNEALDVLKAIKRGELDEIVQGALEAVGG